MKKSYWLAVYVVLTVVSAVVASGAPIPWSTSGGGG